MNTILKNTAKNPTASAAVNLGETGVKTLDVWNPETDAVNFSVKEIDVSTTLTKKAILSKISRLYDPLGLVSAVTIEVRIVLQDIWRANDYDWDDPLLDEMTAHWQALFKEIRGIKALEFTRCLKPGNVSGNSELHVFVNASGVANGAVAYLLWPAESGADVRLIAAKARVAPLQQTTIQRLELIASFVAFRLAKTIWEEFKIEPTSVTFWSDSKIVLQWLN